MVIETDLTEEEREWMRQGREEIARGEFVTLEDFKRELADDVASPEDILAHKQAMEDYRNGECIPFAEVARKWGDGTMDFARAVEHSV
ncbi:MAG: hypothetical protein LBN05_07410 [Oscillospiraceae bacterium]|nr:hypothetical protein [Oscillospiraceae bacterium]